LTGPEQPNKGRNLTVNEAGPQTDSLGGSGGGFSRRY